MNIKIKWAEVTPHDNDDQTHVVVAEIVEPKAPLERQGVEEALLIDIFGDSMPLDLDIYWYDFDLLVVMYKIGDSVALIEW